MGLMDSIKEAFRVLPELAGAVGQLALTIIVITVVLGVFIYQVVTAGNISVDTVSSNLVSQQSSNFSSMVNVIWGAATSVGGFIVLAVIALIAVGILGKKFLGGSNV